MKKRLTKLCSVVMSLMLALVCVTFAGCSDKPENPSQDQQHEQTSAPAIADVVEVEGGKIRGVKEGEVFSFKGIPYAAPPVGENRWKRPQPVQPWEGIKNCTQFGNSAFQPPQEVVEGSKDTA